MKKSLPDNSSDAFAVFFESVPSDGIVKQSAKVTSAKKDWNLSEHEEGKLAVDIVETKDSVIVISTMAGALTEKIEVYIHGDLLTIRGQRLSPLADVSKAEPVHQECFWGAFSRSVVLPVEVKGELAKADYKNGILRVDIPKRTTEKRIQVQIVEE